MNCPISAHRVRLPLGSSGCSYLKPQPEAAAFLDAPDPLLMSEDEDGADLQKAEGV